MFLTIILVLELVKLRRRRREHLIEKLKNTPVTKYQRTQFGITNDNCNALEIAEKLLCREYGDTHLFGKKKNEPIFIPSEFVYNGEWYKEIALLTPILEVLKNIYEKHDDGNNNQNIWLEELKELINRMDSKKENDDYDEFAIIEKWWRSNVIRNPVNSSVKEDLSKYLFNRNIGNIKGDVAESFLFNKLKNGLKLKGDFTILQSCELPKITKTENGSRKTKHVEKDFIIFSASRKEIISIEVKYRYKKEVYEQVHDTEDILFKYFDLEGWKSIPVIFIYIPGSTNRKETETKVFTRNTVDVLLKDIIGSSNDQLAENNEAGNSNDEKANDQLKAFLQVVIFALYKNVKLDDKGLLGALVPSKLTDHITYIINKIWKASDIMFYTKEQHQILTSNSPKYKKVMITGPYGTGKSIVLQEKAKNLAENGHKVLFLLGCAENSLLQKYLEFEWRELITDGKIILQNSKNNLMDFEERLSCLKVQHVFIDEMYHDKPSVLNVIENNIVDYFWICPSKDFEVSNDLVAMKHFEQVQLKMILGNTKQIARLARSGQYVTREEEHDEGFIWKGKIAYENDNPNIPVIQPDGEEIKVIHRGTYEITKACKEMRKIVNGPFVFLVRALWEVPLDENNDISEEERLTEFKRNSQSFLNIILETLEETGEIVKVYVCFPEFMSNLGEMNPEQFLRGEGEFEGEVDKKKRILITDTEAMAGFQWPSIIFYKTERSSNISYQRPVNVYSRATTKLIICYREMSTKTKMMHFHQGNSKREGKTTT